MKYLVSVVLSTLVLASVNASAHHRDRDAEYGRVISVEPVYRTYSRPISDNSCLRYDRSVPVRTHYTGTILGAVIGGALGHRIGDAHGDADAAAVAGGLLGASIGHRVDQQQRYHRQLRVSGPCRPQYREERVRELVEYKVTYRYNGKIHHAVMDHDPGKWVKLNVDVSPA